MKKQSLGIAVLTLVVAAAPLWAWGHGGGYGGHGYGGHGWGGRGYYGGRGYGGVSIGIGGPWWPYYYPYYDPYYAAPGPYVYADPNVAVYPDSPPTDADLRSPDADDASRHDLRRVNQSLSRLRALYDYKYSDGDIDKTQYDAGLRYLGEIDQEARAEAGANGGALTGDQEASLLRQLQQVNPESSRAYPHVVATPAAAERQESAPAQSRRDLSAVSDLLLELRALLNQKLKEGAITQPQHDAEAAYLDQIERKARAGGNSLPESEENGLVQQLHQAYYAINHNLIVH